MPLSSDQQQAVMTLLRSYLANLIHSLPSTPESTKLVDDNFCVEPGYLWFYISIHLATNLSISIPYTYTSINAIINQIGRISFIFWNKDCWSYLYNPYSHLKGLSIETNFFTLPFLRCYLSYPESDKIKSNCQFYHEHFME